MATENEIIIVRAVRLYGSPSNERFVSFFSNVSPATGRDPPRCFHLATTIIYWVKNHRYNYRKKHSYLITNDIILRSVQYSASAPCKIINPERYSHFRAASYAQRPSWEPVCSGQSRARHPRHPVPSHLLSGRHRPIIRNIELPPSPAFSDRVTARGPRK